MHHFPASPRDSTSSSGLNATQRNVRPSSCVFGVYAMLIDVIQAAADPMFSLIHDELHDARRVQKHGQEDDLRAALDMVIRRVESMVRRLPFPCLLPSYNLMYIIVYAAKRRTQIPS